MEPLPRPRFTQKNGDVPQKNTSRTDGLGQESIILDLLDVQQHYGLAIEAIFWCHYEASLAGWRVQLVSVICSWYRTGRIRWSGSQEAPKHLQSHPTCSQLLLPQDLVVTCTSQSARWIQTISRNVSHVQRVINKTQRSQSGVLRHEAVSLIGPR